MCFAMEDNSKNILLTPNEKRNVTFKREFPFPIVNPSCGENVRDQAWKIAVGHLQDNCVLVHDEESIKKLYCMGFFGKGTLSKYTPSVCLKRRNQPPAKKRRVSAPETQTPKQGKNADADVIDVIDSDDDDDAANTSKVKDVEVVLSDSSSSEEDNGPRNEPSKESDSTEKESLQLTFEEAYFLSYGLGCLVVKDKDQMLNLSRLWIKLCDLTPGGSFPVMYTAYHHFRSKGWVVKCGLKFGADFLLYKDGPPFYHATYSVIVKPVKEQNLRDIRGNRHFTWASLCALNRVNSAAGKGLLFLYVIRPHSMSENKVATPFVISQFRLEEVIFKRWVASQNREDEDEESAI